MKISLSFQLWRIKLNICQVKIKKKKILSVEIIFKK